MKKPPILLDSCGGNGFIINLQYIPTPENGRVLNNFGTGFIVPLVDDTNAGLMSPEMYAGLVSPNEIDITTTVSGASVTVEGDELSGTITIATGATGLSGDLFNITTISTFLDKSAIIISDAYDNFAMGHTSVFRMRISGANQLRLSVKTGITLELNQTYKLYYLIKI
jgi:hypothetical protein